MALEFDGKLPISPYVQYNPFTNPLLTGYAYFPIVGGLQQFEYTGWRDEELSWHDNCYIHAGLNPFLECKITGPDVIPFLSYNLTNGLKNFPVGSIRHAMMVTDKGTLVADGLALRTGEFEVETTCLTPTLQWRASQQDFDVEIEDLMGKTFFYQLGGPRSLEVVEAAAEHDFHDLGFLQHTKATIAGAEVRIQRIGMAGSLAYEVHGMFEDCQAVYARLLEAGEEFGLRKLGRHAYWNTHTENGFPQSIIHFPYATEQEEEMWKMLVETNSPVLSVAASLSNLTGSVGRELDVRYVNPIELGWEGGISFKKDFVGKEALERIKAEGTRQMVTLEWNADDVCDVWRSGIEGGEPYYPMDGPEDYDPTGTYEYRADWVLADGKKIGISTGRIHSWYYRKMISLALIDPAYAVEGKELVVLWGNEGSRQKEIRAKVARYPYMNENRNEDVDVMACVPRRYA